MLLMAVLGTENEPCATVSVSVIIIVKPKTFTLLGMLWNAFFCLPIVQKQSARKQSCLKIDFRKDHFCACRYLSLTRVETLKLSVQMKFVRPLPILMTYAQQC